MATEESQPFFHRASTKQYIADLASVPQLAVYAGAGVTIDRSGLDWGALINGLLTPYVALASERKELVASLGASQAGSIAAQLYIDDHGPRASARMSDRLRVLLYSSGDWQAGRLAATLANLVVGSNLRQIEAGTPGPASILITPNYDSYLWEELVKAAGELGGHPRTQAQRLFPTTQDPLDSNSDADQMRDWVRDVGNSSPSRSACVHLHGFIPRNEASRLLRYPVVSEQDYFRTAAMSKAVLQAIFEQSAVLVTGASLTDPPLLRALYDTRDSGHARYAIVPLTAPMPIEKRAVLKRRLRERYRHFGIIPIYTDFYSQIDQFVNEVGIAAGLSDPLSYASPGQIVRYGARLTRWWTDWFSLVNTQYDENQLLFHEILAALRETVRVTLDASFVEPFKLELWVRWKPSDDRQMNLWASSTGPWADPVSMRNAQIAAQSDFKSITAFTSGRPTYTALSDAELPHQRWRTYLSVPVYWASDLDGSGELSVGAMTVASMWPESESALSPSGNRARLTELVNLLSTYGSTMLIPDRDGWDRLHDNLTALLHR